PPRRAAPADLRRVGLGLRPRRGQALPLPRGCALPLRRAVALLVLLAAAAGAGGVAAHLGLLARDRARLHHVAVGVVPAALDLAEAGPLVVRERVPLHLVAGDELHLAGLVVRAAGGGRHDLEPLPGGLLRPLLGRGLVHLLGGAGIVGGEDPRDLAEGVGAVARAHERLGGRRRLGAGDVAQAA